MSEYAPGDGSPPQHGCETSLASLEDTFNAADNSIMGKVKSRVSSILPNSFSKWFSPSTKLQNDSLNGSLSCANTTQPARRRRRLEVEEEDNYDDEIQRGEENSVDDDDEEEEDNDDEESQNSEEQYFTYDGGLTKPTRRALIEERQPPAKKSRLNVNVRDNSPLITGRQPLQSSTPAVGSTYVRNSSSTTNEIAPRSTSYQRFTNLNLYAHQSKKEPAFSFGGQQNAATTATTKINTDIIDLISNPPNETENKQINSYHGLQTRISSRKSLNIPSSSLTSVERVYATVAQLKRQPISSAKNELSTGLSGGVPPRRTSTTIHEVVEDFVEQECAEDTAELSESNAKHYNGRRVEETNKYVTNKRIKLVNGTSNLNTNEISDINEAIIIDSASESGESSTDATKTNPSNLQQQQQQQRKTGHFNISAIGAGGGNTRNSSRTSSFGNGLNFYSHLEGRKSLFSGNNHGASNPLNNSTLSLTSLNRRQFNASIYGSTSALSDSRLLNTFSPFYKGKTTYGGAAAYNKYTSSAGASAVRITPTLIRPTSSLSTLSSSNNSLANNANSQQVGDNSTISSTAKRILDLINDFATPLSEAKKMASNLKTNPHLQITPQAKGRLNESDLNASRTMRLSQVRTPYARPAVILQPSGNANGRGMIGGPLPPVRELQVPTMSQLLQMKKIQNTTEKARRITTQNTRNKEAHMGIAEYTLPGVTSITTDNVSEREPHQRHTNKIKNKVTNTSRPSAASKGLQDDEPPPPVNLPHIAFPLMQSVPKIDIQLSRPTASNSVPAIPTTKTPASDKTEATKSTIFAFNTKPLISTPPHTTTTTSKADFKTMQTINNTSTTVATSLKTTNAFKFSEPLQVEGATTTPTHNNTTYMNNYKFSPPLDVTSFSLTMPQDTTPQNTQLQQPQLKAGSCLDALSKPFTMPTTPKQTAVLSPLAAGFGNQFKKSSNEWECDACMIRNKVDLNKCVACETPRKQSTAQQTPSNSSHMTPLTSTFGDQFKKSSAEWECDTCMIRNKAESTKCVACEAPRMRNMSATSASTTSMLPPIKNSFGDAFKPKSGSWECQTCMITNATDVYECVACQTKKPVVENITNCSSVAPPASQFKFGFVSANATNASSSPADAGFKTLAAQQKASKWECDACMTRNDANRTKCACCEQPKPGTTNIESSSSTNKFSFGATAAAKFSFGFGPAANAPKEEDLKKELANKADEKKTALGLANKSSSTPVGGFQFGIKPIATIESKKDETDAKLALTGIKFGLSADTGKKSETFPTTTAATGLVFGTKSLATTASSSSSTVTTTTVNSPSVKFNLPTIKTTSSNDKPTGVAAPTFSFGTSNTASASSFAFGNKSADSKSTAATKEIKSLEGFSFKTPTAVSTTTAQSSGFVFGSPAANKNSTTAVSSSNNTTTTASSATTAAVKPMFGGFSFGGTSTTSTTNTATPTTGNILFGAVTSTSTTSTTANASSLSTATTTPASTNIFGGSFGGDGGGGGGSTNTPSATPIFGSSTNPPANNSTTVSSSTNSSTNKTPQFGTFGAKTETSNVFGSFGSSGGGGSGGGTSINKTIETKPTLPIFGNVASSSTSQSSNSSSFLFGSSNALNSTIAPASTGSTTATGSVTSTSTAWPKNSFVFGTSAAQATSTNLAAPNANELAAKPSVFSTFGTPSTNAASQQQATSIFGAPAASNTTAASLPAFGTVAAGSTNSSTNLFGTNSVPAATNVFGANSSGTAATPAFGSSPFGGSASSTSVTPTFGSTAAAGSITFGGFGASAVNNTTSNATAEVKKPEAAFNFGAAPSTQSTSGGFNFGSSSSSSTKPAFNFGGTATAQQPTFNFTGSAESQNSTKPFQFGATPSAPVYDFSRGALEGTPNAPFQFNAGAAPVTSNIFAPTPTPGAQTAQQAKRKIRAPIRRVTQR